MEMDVRGSDVYGNDAYKALFEVIMADIGKAIMMENVTIVLKPDVPMFIFSVRLRNAPDDVRMRDAASIRSENDVVYITISDERYAPEILSQLWNEYGRSNVEQSTRFDITVAGGDEERIGNMKVSSQEEVLKELIGAVWRAMPEGIRVRHDFIDNNVVTILATEEILRPEMLAEAKELHDSMVV